MPKIRASRGNKPTLKKRHSAAAAARPGNQYRCGLIENPLEKNRLEGPGRKSRANQPNDPKAFQVIRVKTGESAVQKKD